MDDYSLLHGASAPGVQAPAPPTDAAHASAQSAIGPRLDRCRVIAHWTAPHRYARLNTLERVLLARLGGAAELARLAADYDAQCAQQGRARGAGREAQRRVDAALAAAEVLAEGDDGVAEQLHLAQVCGNARPGWARSRACRPACGVNLFVCKPFYLPGVLLGYALQGAYVLNRRRLQRRTALSWWPPAAAACKRTAGRPRRRPPPHPWRPCPARRARWRVLRPRERVRQRWCDALRIRSAQHMEHPGGVVCQ